MRRWRRLAWIAAAAALGGLLGFVRLPLYAVGPGSAHEVTPLIRVVGHSEYRTGGRLVMTTIAFRPLTTVGAVAAWLDPSWSVVREEELFLPGETEEQEARRARSEMDRSKIAAISVVLTELVGYPEQHTPGALVEDVVPGCPAAGRLFPGDVVTAIDGEGIDDVGEAGRVIESTPPGEPLTFRVRGGGQIHDVEVERRACVEGEEPIVGVVLAANFPFRVRIASGAVGGPSAGLMWALGLYDLLTPGDLTGGEIIAGTGIMDAAGAVSGIGGIEAKLRAAHRADVGVFLVPRENLAEAEAAQVAGVRLVPVGTFDEAVAFLEGTA